MKTKSSQRLDRLIIACLTLCGPSLAHPAFIKTNFASSITGESMSAVWVAPEQGLFRKYGLDMQFIIMPRPPLTIAAMIAGEIDMAVTGPGTFLNASIGGVDIVGIANFFQKLDYTLNGRPELKKPEDLQESGSRSAEPALPRILCPACPAKLGHRPKSSEDQLYYHSRNGTQPPDGSGVWDRRCHFA
jgi:hypothetical protein